MPGKLGFKCDKHRFTACLYNTSDTMEKKTCFISREVDKLESTYTIHTLSGKKHIPIYIPIISIVIKKTAGLQWPEEQPVVFWVPVIVYLFVNNIYIYLEH